METTLYQWSRQHCKMVQVTVNFYLGTSLVNINFLHGSKDYFVHSSLYLWLPPCVHVYAVPSGYPSDLVVTAESPNSVVLEWSPVPEIDWNGVITVYEVVFSQSSIEHLPQSGTLSASYRSTSVAPLQPFIPYNLTVRAFTINGTGPFNPTPILTTIDDTTGKCFHLLIYPLLY